MDDNFKKVIKESGIPYLKLNGVYDLQQDLVKVDHELMDFMQKNMGNDINGNNHEMGHRHNPYRNDRTSCDGSCYRI